MKSMKNIISKSLITAASVSLLMTPMKTSASESLLKYDASLPIELVGRYTSGAPISAGGTEIVAYDKKTKHAFSVNGDQKSIDIIDLSVLKKGEKVVPKVKQIPLSSFGVEASDVTSVAIHPDGGYIAIAAPAKNKTNDGHVVFMTTGGEYIAHVKAGALPDMLTFTPDGKKVLVANEGEPSDDYKVNPEGSVSIIDISKGVKNIKNNSVTTVRFDEKAVDKDVRKIQPKNSYAVELEPEYIVTDKGGKYAYVALQENNAIAKLDIEKKKFTTVKSLGYKDFSVNDNQLDASDKDGKINIQNWPILSMYMPDGMASYEVKGKTYILTANEGDAQDYKGFSEEARVEDLVNSYKLNAKLYKGFSQEQLDKMVKDGLFKKEQLGRLKTTTAAPKNKDGKYEAIYGYGARSFSIWDANSLKLTYDSGSDFEKITAEAVPNHFNANNTEDELDSRSDDKGPEPESVIVGNVKGKNYAFIGLERTGGIMVYDVTNPEKPRFNTYISSRTFNGGKVTASSNDVAPEGLTFIPASDSPTGQDLLLAAHEVTGTIAVYSLGGKTDK
ncbi:choice-of-anchor I family protein [Metabacillus fastidiosus]|uniref:Choice-of-anchor I family protein n=1 Tax=Metabacillus fastidiosus TaxID=1458 RepID=A0ABU6NXV8_9BACI|nr:choice-of-anchor I family protein [Metabacillus fastidiosus]MED4401946.1 choice-of-anchor I family protein [Metabacillus fastidiosus]MED4460921.1 choice-of-anchor I family protein [Metabacillus fastidiosus]